MRFKVGWCGLHIVWHIQGLCTIYIHLYWVAFLYQGWFIVGLCGLSGVYKGCAPSVSIYPMVGGRELDSVAITYLDQPRR